MFDASTGSAAENANLSDSEPAIDPKIAAMVDVFGPVFVERFNEPVLYMAADLYSPVAQGMYRRDFALLSRSLLLESVYRRRPGFNEAILDAFAANLQSQLAKVMNFFTVRTEQLVKLFTSQGITPEPVYIKVRHISSIPVIATHARSFIMMLRQLDDYYQLTGCATLVGILDGGQRRTAETQARKVVRAFAAVVRLEAIKLRKESMRLATMSAEPASEEVKLAESIADKGMVEHDAAAASTDETMHSDDAASILDGIASAAVATGKAASRGKAGLAAAQAAFAVQDDAGSVQLAKVA